MLYCHCYSWSSNHVSFTWIDCHNCRCTEGVTLSCVFSMCVGLQDEFLLYTCTNRVVVMWSTLINKVMIIWCMKLDLFLSFFDWGVVACSVYNLWQQMSRRFIILQSTLQTFWWICALCHVLCNCLERLVQNHLGLFSIQV